MHTKRTASTVGWLTVLLAVTAQAAAAGTPQRIKLILDDALPYVAAERTRNHLHDLHISCTLRDGRVDANAWAWSPAAPAIEHPATVTRSKLTNDALELTVTIDVKPVLPTFRGGKGVVTLSLQRDGPRLRGRYDANFVALSAQELTAWWRSIGGGQNCPVTAGLRTARTHSILRVPRRFSGAGGDTVQPVVATGAIQPTLPRRRHTGGPQFMSELAPGDKNCIDANSARRIHRMAADEPNEPLIQAMAHRLRPDGGFSARALTAAEASLASLEGDWERHTLTPLTLGRTLAHTAAALDTCGRQWPEAQRAAIAAAVAMWARRLTLHSLPESINNVPPKGFLLSQADGPYDARIAVVRAAQGLAAIVARRAGQPAADLQTARTIARRSVRRYARTAFGRNGAPIGQHGLSETLQIVAMYALAERRAGGMDISAGTGLARIGQWGWTTRGLGIEGRPLSDNADWLGAAALLSEEKLAGQLMAAIEQVLPPSTPSAEALAMLATARIKPTTPPARSAAAIDRTMKSIVFNDPDANATVLFHAGEVPRVVAQRRGHFVVSALGRNWITPPNPPSPLSWPVGRRMNTLQAYRAALTSRTGVAALGPGRMMRVRSYDHGGSVSMLAEGFQQLDGRGRPTGKQVDDNTRIWRTLGVDTSGRCGADVLLVTVGGATGLKDRQRVWEINVGDLASEHVSIRGRRFTIAPPHSKATLTGTMVYPPTGHITYRSPTDGRQGRLRCAMTPPGRTNDQILTESMDKQLVAIRKLAEGVDWEDPNTIELEIEAPFDIPKETTPDPEKEQADAQAVLNKLFRHTSSTKMGGGDRFLRAIGSCVVVLTIHTGDAPPVVIAPKDARELLTVGDVRVRYREHLLTFEPKTQEAK